MPALTIAVCASAAVHVALLVSAFWPAQQDAWEVGRRVPGEALQVRLADGGGGMAFTLQLRPQAADDTPQAASAEDAVSGAAEAPPADSPDAYRPRALLTRPPRAREPVSVPWPPGVWPAGLQSGRFTLFIDETGQVRRVVADGPSLPPPMEEAVRQRFMGVRFVPGEWHGQPVRSLMRIELVFGNEDTAPGAGPSAAVPAPPAVVLQRKL